MGQAREGQPVGAEGGERRKVRGEGERQTGTDAAGSGLQRGVPSKEGGRECNQEANEGSGRGESDGSGEDGNDNDEDTDEYDEEEEGDLSDCIERVLARAQRETRTRLPR